MSARNTKNNRFRKCPDCGAPLLRRSSMQVTPLIVQTFMFCKNNECGASFSGIDEIVSRVSIPGNPNPDINLPISKKKKPAIDM